MHYITRRFGSYWMGLLLIQWIISTLQIDSSLVIGCFFEVFVRAVLWDSSIVVMNPCDLPRVFDHTTPAFRQVITYITPRIRHYHYYLLKKWSNAMVANPFTDTALEISQIFVTFVTPISLIWLNSVSLLLIWAAIQAILPINWNLNWPLSCMKNKLILTFHLKSTSSNL